MIDTVRGYSTPTNYTSEAFQKACSAGEILPGTILEKEDCRGEKTWGLFFCIPPHCPDGYSNMATPREGVRALFYPTSNEIRTITAWKVDDQRAKRIQQSVVQFTPLPRELSSIVAHYETPTVSNEELFTYTTDATIALFRLWSGLPEIPPSLRQGLGVYLEGFPIAEHRPPRSNS